MIAQAKDIKPGLITIEDVRRIVENYFTMIENGIIAKDRKRDIVIPRQIAHFWCKINKYQQEWSLANIGNTIGGKDHATVLHSFKRISNAIDTREKYHDILIEQHVETIDKKIYAFYRSKKQTPTVGIETETIRESTRAYSKNELLSLAGMAQSSESLHNRASIMRRAFEEQRNSGRYNGRPYSAYQSRKSIRLAERQIRKAFRRRKFTNIM